MSGNTDNEKTKSSAGYEKDKLLRFQQQRQQRLDVSAPRELLMSRSSSEKCNICSKCKNIKYNQTTGCVSGCVAGAIMVLLVV